MLTISATLLAATLGCTDSTPTDSTPVRQEVDLLLAGDRPNVILVTIDTLRADRLSIYGSDVKTPNMDGLAEDGVLFTNASTTVPFTFPAHSSIMTGTYPPFHGVRENVGYYLGEDNVTLAQRLGDAGWQTAGFVSAFVLDSRWGIGRGFGHYFDDFDLAAFEDANMASVQRPGPETIGAALRWLDQRPPDTEKPFFLWLHLFDPHDPYTPPEPFRSQYPGAPYDGEVAYTDSLIGGFLADLEERDLVDDSLIVLTADHGEGLGDHGETSHGYFVYDSTVHVPLILRLPGKALSGTSTAEPVSHVDIVPTVLDLVGLEARSTLQGQSLLDSLEPQSVTEEDGSGRVVYAESFYPLLHYGWAPLRALRSATHKYIEAPNPELFDLWADPTEGSNLANEQRPVTRRMGRALLDLADTLEEGAAATEAADMDETALAQLVALGYLAGPSQVDARSYDPRVARPDPKNKAHLHRRMMAAQSMAGGERAEEAGELLRETLREDPNLLDAHQMLGSIELDAGNPTEAAGHFTNALALDNSHRPSVSGLAGSHRQLGRLDEALLGYRRLLDLAGQDTAATVAIADIEVERGNLREAEEALSEAAQPGAPAVLFNRLGEVQTLAGNPDAAYRNLQIAIEGNPRLSQPHFNLAVLSEQAGDLDGARTQYEEAIERAPKHYKAQFNLALLMARLGDRQRERDLLEESIASRPTFAIGHFFLGKSLMESGDLQGAEEVTRAGLELGSEGPLGWLVLADILNRQGRSNEANEALASARALSG